MVSPDRYLRYVRLYREEVLVKKVVVAAAGAAAVGCTALFGSPLAASDPSGSSNALNVVGVPCSAFRR